MPTWQDVQDVVTYYDENKGGFRVAAGFVGLNAARASCVAAYAKALATKKLQDELTIDEIASLLCAYEPSRTRHELRDQCFEMLAPKLLGIELPEGGEVGYENVPQYSARHVVDFVLIVRSYTNVASVLHNFKQPLDRTGKLIAIWTLGEMVRVYEETYRKAYGSADDVKTMINKFIQTDHINDLVTGHPVQVQRPCSLHLTSTDIPCAASVLKMFDLQPDVRGYLSDMLGTLTRAGIYSGEKYDQIIQHHELLLNNVMNAEWLRLNINPELLTNSDWSTMIHICRLRDTEGDAEINMNEPNEARAKSIYAQKDGKFTASIGEVITQVLGREQAKLKQRCSF